MKRTFKKSELMGQRGYVTQGVGVRLYPLCLWEDGSESLNPEGQVVDYISSEYGGDTTGPLTGEPLVAALRERGVEVVEDTAEASAKPEVDEWGMWDDQEFGNDPVYHRNGDLVDVYDSRGGEMFFGQDWSDYVNTTEVWRPLTPAEVETFKAKIASHTKPEVKPTETPAFKVGDRVEVLGPLDKWWVRYVHDLEERIGQTGEISAIDADACRVDFNSGPSWCFQKHNLRHTTASPTEAEQLRKQLNEAIAKNDDLHERNTRLIDRIGSADDQLMDFQFTVGHLRKELDEAKATITRLRDSLTKAENDQLQPPMSDERFLQEAAMKVMCGVVASIPTNERQKEVDNIAEVNGMSVYELVADVSMRYATALLSALRKEQQ